jgi:hypothetical protein
MLSMIRFPPSLSELKQETAKVWHITKGAKIYCNLRSKTFGWFTKAESPAPFLSLFSNHNSTATVQDSCYYIGSKNNGHLKDPAGHLRYPQAVLTVCKVQCDVRAYLTLGWVKDPYSKEPGTAVGRAQLT